jgi:arylsulfatase A-like enzyme
MLSGLRPQDHGVRRFLDLYDGRSPLVCDLLPESFQSAAFVSNAMLTDEALGIASCFDAYDDYVDEREGPVRKMYERSARRTTDAALAWLRTEQDAEKRLLLWVHYIDPHGPYQPPEDADVDFSHEGQVSIVLDQIPGYSRIGIDDGLELLDRYDEEIAYADREIGRLLAGWAESSEVDQDLVIFTSDHGESMLEHSRHFDHGHHVWEYLIRIPLMIRAPGLEPGQVRGTVSLLDVLPTLLAFAGVASPTGLSGIDLLSETPATDRVVYAESFFWTTAVNGSHKWMARFSTGHRSPKETRFYDLGSDPEEAMPREWSAPTDASVSLLEHARSDPIRIRGGHTPKKGFTIRDPKVSPRATEEQLEQLRGLGYIE